MALQLKRPIAFFDIESTGPVPDKDRIVEIAILKILPDGSEELKTARVNPGMPIPQEAIDVHGITDKDVADKPSFKQISKSLMDYLEDCDLAGYNSNRFDIPMLIEEFYRSGLHFQMAGRQSVDVFKIFQKMERRDLSSAYKFYCDKELEGAHGAEADIRATYEVLKGQIDRYEDIQGEVNFLAEFSKDGDFVDYARRMAFQDGVEVFNFGKHKGKGVEEVLAKDSSYYTWMMNADFPRDTKEKLTAIKKRMALKNKWNS